MKTNIRNLEVFYQIASQDDLESGLVWYDETRAILAQIALEADLPLSIVAGCGAVLSPGVGWAKVMEFLPGYILEGGPMPGWSINLAKAQQILAGDFSALRGPKVQAFYDNLVNPDSRRVTVDRWAWRAWLGDVTLQPPSGSTVARKYPQIERDYIALADQLGLQPCRVQAVIWLTVRNLGG